MAKAMDLDTPDRPDPMMFVCFFSYPKPRRRYHSQAGGVIGHIGTNGSEIGVRFSDGTFPVSTNHRQGLQGPIRKQDSQLCPPPYPGL